MKLLLACCFLLVFGTARSQGYFQQEVDYRIEVTLDDELHTLTGDEIVVYKNNSPDTLHFLYFHLWPNAYKNRKTALARQLFRQGNLVLFYADEGERGYIDSLDFRVDGEPVQWKLDEEHIDICRIDLAKPLQPGESIEISTPFHVKFPVGSISRLGHIDQQYQVAQWYPKPAVYDQYGWHAMPYLNQGEFYSEFGSFDVSITLPANYVVGATGDLQPNATEEAFLKAKIEETEKWLDTTAASGNWSATEKDLAFPPSEGEMKTLRFKQENVHDFAWFADKRYRVLADTVNIGGNTVQCVAMFTDREARLWKDAPEYIARSIRYYSRWNGDYPYSHATAVDGALSAGAGMEYPNITVIGTSGNAMALETVIMHEVGHNWFYGILGSNERRYPFMDEGLNTYNEMRYKETVHPEKGVVGNKGSWLSRFLGLERYGDRETYYQGYLFQLRRNEDQPINLHSSDYSEINYGMIVYFKTGQVFNYLRKSMGDAAMDSIMHGYFNRWKFKHPYPEDLRQVFAQNREGDYAWLFDDFIPTRKKLNYAVRKIRRDNGVFYVHLRNKGGIAGPVGIAPVHGDSAGEVKWISGFSRDTVLQFSDDATAFRIDPEHYMPEFSRKDNYSRTKGILRKAEPFQLKFFAGVEDPYRTQLFYTPVISWNYNNGLMPGVALYNHVVPSKRLEYVFVPMFSLRSLELVGLGDIHYNIRPRNSFFKNLRIGARAKRFYSFNPPEQEGAMFVDDFIRLEPYLTLLPAKKNANGYFSHEIHLSTVQVFERFLEPENAGFNTSTYGAGANYFNRLRHEMEVKYPLLRVNTALGVEQNPEFSRVQGEVLLRPVTKTKAFAQLRLFGGYFIGSDNTPSQYAYQVSGQDFRSDYAYDHTLLDRSGTSGFWHRQMTLTHGALKAPVRTARVNRYLIASNFKSTIGRLPVGVFGDVVLEDNGEIWADAGVYLKIVPNKVEAFLPLLITQNIWSVARTNDLKVWDLLRFQVSFSELNPFKLIEEFDI